MESPSLPSGKPKQKPGPKPVDRTLERPHLPEEWEHLRAWWAEHGALYNVRELGRRLAIDHIALGQLLKGTGRNAATAERLDSIKDILSTHYQEK